MLARVRPRDRGRVPSALVTSLLAMLLGSASAHAISSRTLIAPFGAAAGDEFGLSVGTAGDVNGDGYPDVIIGATLNDAGGSNAGRAYVYFGGPGADAVADWTLTGAVAADGFGFAVGTAGDVNRDGYADVIVGAPFNGAGGALAGRAYVYFGSPVPDAVADLTLTGAAAGDNFGYSVGTAGDLNGDGFADVVVGALLNDAGGVDAGRAYVFYGAVAPNASADLTATGAAADDEFGVSVGTAGDMNSDGYSDLIVGANFNDAAASDAGRAYVFLGGIVADNTADLTLTGAVAGDFFGTSVGTAGDFNGDGFSDVIVGAQLSDVGGVSAGQAYVYYGGGIADATADVVLTGSGVGDLFGFSVGTAGDVNGDGFSDVIVGAYGSDVGGLTSGEAFVYFGGASPNSIADVYLVGADPGESYGLSVGTAGDMDGDGYDDVVVGAPFNDAGGLNAGRARVTLIYPYQLISPNGGEQWVAGQSGTVHWLGHDPADIAVSLDGGATYSTLASGVGGAEDNEAAVAVPGPGTELGRVRVSQTGATVRHSTSDASDEVFRIALPASPPAAASRLDLTPTGAAAGDNLGFSVGTAGDVNGDGYADVIAGAPTNDAGGVNAGRAYVYYGGPASDAVADWTLTGAAAGDQFGCSVGTAGDVNGDGYADVIVGAYLNDAGGVDAGRAYVFFGGAAPDVVADMTLAGAAAGDQFGYSVGTAGDENGDGFADVIVGAPLSDLTGSNAGRATVYYGGLAPDATADRSFTGAVTNDSFGYSVGTAGDVNGDGYADAIVGAPFNDGGGNAAGQAYVFFSGPGADLVADVTLTGAAAVDEFGYAVGTAGDFNSDGYGDVIVGAILNDAGGNAAGRAYVYFGGPGVDATADLSLTGVATGDELGYSVGTAGDVNGDGHDDVIVGAILNDAGGSSAGRAYVYYGGPGADAAADLTLTGAATNDDFGLSVGTAGDVNGDGFADVVVGACFNDAGGAEAGRAYVYDCNRYFVLSPNDDEVWNVGAAQSVNWLGAERADLWLSTNGGATYDLARHDVGGEESNALALLVPHTPTRFARVKVTPADLGVRGSDDSDSLFTIQTSVALLNLVAELAPEGGALLTWSSEPGVGPEGLAGYRVYRLAPGAGGAGTRIGPDLIAEGRYHDAAGGAGSRYRIAAVNGLGEELTLGEVSLLAARPLAAWPLPFSGGDLQVSFALYGRIGAASGEAEVALYDVRGRRVRMLASGSFPSTQQQVLWNGRDDAGRRVPAGVYFLRAKSGGMEHAIKIAVTY